MKKYLFLLAVTAMALVAAISPSRAADRCVAIGQEAEAARLARDLSCQTDKDCRLSAAQPCGCAGVGTDERAYSEIMKKGMEEGCFPVIECRAFSCQCTDGKCGARYDRDREKPDTR